jgi:hypothetical protein
MDDNLILKIAGVIIGFVILQVLWNLIFAAIGKARQAFPEGQLSEFSLRAMWVVGGLCFVVFVMASCVDGALNSSYGDYDEPTYRGRG